MKAFLRKIRTISVWYGVLGSIAFIILFPVVLSQLSFNQTTTIKGNYVRNGNRAASKFFSEIKTGNGVLVLGTSETGNNLDGMNYVALLNHDLGRVRFSVLAGAGRTASMYFPLILSNPEVFRGMKVLFFVNPTYWRTDLNYFRKDYYQRYVSPALFQEAVEKAKTIGLYDGFFSPATFDDVESRLIKVSFWDRTILTYDWFRSYYYYDFSRLVVRDDNLETPEFSEPLTSKQFDFLTEGIDLKYNALKSVVNADVTFPEVDQMSNFRYEELQAFYKICKLYHIELTVYLGPYNGVFCNQSNPVLTDQYESVLKNIRQITEVNNVPLIDGTDLSYIPGTFLDVQHISKYCAFRVANQIKKYYEITKNPR